MTQKEAPAWITDAGLDDFRNFVYLAWQYFRVPQDPTDLQYDVANFVQDPLEEGSVERKCIQGFRGLAKTLLCIAYCAWKLRLNPNEKIMVVSAGKTHADHFAITLLRMIREMEVLQDLYPGPDKRRRLDGFDVELADPARDPSVKSVGINSQIVGSRATVIVSDDVEIPSNSDTQAKRDHLEGAVKEFESVILPGGEIIFLGTPQTEASIYRNLPIRGYETRLWPGRYPDERLLSVYGDHLSPMIAQRLADDRSLIGQTTEPSRFSDFDLDEREVSVGRSAFALQFMLDTSVANQHLYPLHVADLIVFDFDHESAPEKLIWSSDGRTKRKDIPNVAMPGDHFHSEQAIVGDWVPYEFAIMYVDPAGRGKDELAWGILKALNGYLYLAEQGGEVGTGYGEDVLEMLAKKAKLHEVNCVVVEENMGAGMFGELMQAHLVKIYPSKVELVRHHTQKEARIIDTLEPVMNQHRLVISPQVLIEDYESTRGYENADQNVYRLIYQMSRLTRTKGCLTHDDRLDGLAMGVAWLREHLGLDADTQIRRRQEDVEEMEYQKFINSFEEDDTLQWVDMGH